MNLHLFRLLSRQKNQLPSVQFPLSSLDCGACLQLLLFLACFMAKLEQSRAENRKRANEKG